jgi:hypothetical protein
LVQFFCGVNADRMLHKTHHLHRHNALATFFRSDILCNNCNRHHSSLKPREHACMYSVLVSSPPYETRFSRTPHKAAQSRLRIDYGEEFFVVSLCSIVFLLRSAETPSRIFYVAIFLSSRRDERIEEQKDQQATFYSNINCFSEQRESGKASLERLQSEMESRRLSSLIGE